MTTANTTVIIIGRDVAKNLPNVKVKLLKHQWDSKSTTRTSKIIKINYLQRIHSIFIETVYKTYSGP